jgi:translation initiation factor IF-2
MAEAVKSIRLSKVVKEFNIGISTVVDFLQKKGIQVESNPNAKITEEAYEILLKEFQSEKAVKEESKLVGLNKVQRETVTLDDSVERKEPRKTQEQEEIIIKNLENVSDDVIKPKIEEKAPKVVGKIELAESKPKKKAEKAEPQPKAEPEKKEEEKPIEKPEPPKEPEIIRAQAKKLEGVTLLGKIDLPVEKKPTPVASSSPDTELDKPKKKKRKRIKSDKVEGFTPSTSNDNRDKFKGRGPRQKGKPVEKKELDEAEIQNQVRETLAKLSGSGKSKASKYRKAKREAVSKELEEQAQLQEQEKSTLKVTEFVTVSELSKMMDVPVNEIISACMSLGMFVSINQRLDAETLSIVAEEFGYKVEFTTADVQESIAEEEDSEDSLIFRSPIVTVMGHVDHGKTSLLDYIRKANVIAGEAGGITQHIGAYSVELDNGKKITFLDTPGHEAFTAMRARGAQVTDIAIIVVAADDSVMPQTKEAINHAQAAAVPMIFAINKIDKPGANPEKIKEQLANMNLLVEDWGGKYQSQEISAKKGTSVDTLLEKVLLEAELLDLKANPDKNASGTIIESSLDKGRGYVTTLLVQAGTLRVGDIILAGCHYGRVRALQNERGQNVDSAGPSTPVIILGMSGAPNAGDRFNVMNDEREAKAIATKRFQLQREQGLRTRKHITLDEIGRRLAIGDFKELNVIVKGDVDGSIEALSDSLLKLSTNNIQVNVIHKSVGQISESDVLLASASDAIIVGFQVRPSLSARKLAEREQIDIRLYSIIYDAIEEVKAAMEGMLAPKLEEKIVCNIEIREVFKITKVGTVAGCYVLDGKVNRNTKVRIIRDGIVVYAGELGSLKRFKDDAKEVAAGYECGLNIKNFNDIKVGDIIEGYEEVEVKQKL